MTNEEWRETVRRQAEATREYLDELWEQVDSEETEDDAREELEGLPLEVVWERGEPFAVVLGTGGPHVEITGGGRQGGYVLHVYWGDFVTLAGESITRTGEYFRELVS